jgi:hypothetical protein
MIYMIEDVCDILKCDTKIIPVNIIRSTTQYQKVIHCKLVNIAASVA